MPERKNLEWTFDTAASLYEKLRPGYPKELYQVIAAYIPIDENSRVVEIGSGGGQATEPILKTGCQLTAVEYGANFCELLKEKFCDDKNFSVINGKFEDAVLADDTYDFVFSASAFHWVPEKIGYEKVYSILKKGGVFARFANHPYRDKGNPALSAKIDAIYAKYYYPYYHKEPQKITEYTEKDAKDRAMLAEKYGFSDIQYALFYRERVFTAQEYIKLLGTYSDHIAIEAAVREPFFAEIGQAIEDFGGSIAIYDTVDLQLARK